MPKTIAAINMTIDGFCDHTAGIADDALHDHYSDLIKDAGAMLYGRTTYQLMEYWRDVLKNPTGNKSNDNFASLIDKVPKIVFSHTLKQLDWDTARLSAKSPKQELIALRQSVTGNIFIGSPGLIAALTTENMIDEYQLCIHPVILGQGLQLFKNIRETISLKLLHTKTFDSGAIILYYEPFKKD